MSTFTSSLPDKLLQRLDVVARRLNLPKNKLLEKALEIYLDQLNRAEYVKSYQMAENDPDIMVIAEEGMAEYLKTLVENEAG
jgi:predicted transcriptional regulator